MKQNAAIVEPASITLLTWVHVIQRCHLSRTEIYRRIKLKTFPAPVKLSPRKNVWPAAVIDKWIAANLKNAGYKDV
jgi:predicted DNA-binding transcriptional regulator AlpA